MVSLVWEVRSHVKLLTWVSSRRRSERWNLVYVGLGNDFKPPPS